MNPFVALQSAIAARLAADPWLATLPVITEDKGEIESLIDQALSAGGVKAGDDPAKTGLALVVLTPGCSAPAEAGDGRTLDIVVQVEVVELVTTNLSDSGTGKRALDAVWQIYCLLQSWAQHPGAAPGRFVQYASQDQGGTLRYIQQFIFRRTPTRTQLTP